ncbi:MAG: hypothetical protein QGF00_32995, partial [Planctomycetota bacterium]|nr:hypothetical protein [Planctomycetota bacterium]
MPIPTGREQSPCNRLTRWRHPVATNPCRHYENCQLTSIGLEPLQVREVFAAAPETTFRTFLTIVLQAQPCPFTSGHDMCDGWSAI